MDNGITTDDLIDMLNSQSDEAYAAGYSHWGHTMSDAVDAIAREMRRAAWFRQRCDALQAAQKHMRDPERKMTAAEYADYCRHVRDGLWPDFKGIYKPGCEGEEEL